jgi:hypothetical protein
MARVWLEGLGKLKNPGRLICENKQFQKLIEATFPQ